MRAINHALTGAVIGISIDAPLIALPLAFLSHFVVDAIPHYGASDKTDDTLRKKSFTNGLYIDAALCLGLVVILAISQPKNWLQAIVAAFLAASPDLFSYTRYRAAKNNKPYTPNLYSRFAKNIQWFEKPIGAWVEVVWFFMMSLVMFAIIH